MKRLILSSISLLQDDAFLQKVLLCISYSERLKNAKGLGNSSV